MMVLDGPAHQDPTARALVGPPGYKFARKTSIKDRRATATNPPPSKIITAVENHKRRITEDYGGLRRITQGIRDEYGRKAVLETNFMS